MFFSMESIKWPAIKVQTVTNTSAAEKCVNRTKLLSNKQITHVPSSHYFLTFFQLKMLCFILVTDFFPGETSPLCSIINTYLLTYLLTPWSRVLLEKLTGYSIINRKYIYIYIYI